jgi:hypothetical protein
MSEQYNAGERQHVRQAARAARVADRQQREFVTNLMSNIAGRAWLFSLLEACHVFATSHTANALNTAFAEGERNIGLLILNDVMAACPDQYVVMMKEANGRRTAGDNIRKPATATDSTGPEPAAEPDDDEADGAAADDIYTEYDRTQVLIEQGSPERST